MVDFYTFGRFRGVKWTFSFIQSLRAPKPFGQICTTALQNTMQKVMKKSKKIYNLTQNQSVVPQNYKCELNLYIENKTNKLCWEGNQKIKRKKNHKSHYSLNYVLFCFSWCKSRLWLHFCSMLGYIIIYLTIFFLHHVLKRGARMGSTGYVLKSIKF